MSQLKNGVEEKKRFRMMYKFWLDVNKQDEFELAEIIDELKQAHQFARTVRDGIRLVWSLRHRDLNVLFSLFPWIEDRLQPWLIMPDNSHLHEEIAGLRELITRQLQTSSVEQGSPKSMNVAPVASPVFDDDDDFVLDLHKDTSSNAAHNFVHSMMNLQ